MNVGYLVPQFPGQTHAFFWREIEELESQGVLVDVVSTTPPHLGGQPHAWSSRARERTTYLARPSVETMWSAARLVLRSTLKKRLKPAFDALVIDAESTLSQRIGVLLAAVALAARARQRNWTHVHVHSCGTSAWIALVASQLGDLTYSLTLHGSLSDYGGGQKEKWRGSAFVLVITRGLLEDVRNELGELPGLPIDVSPMGIRPEELVRSDPYRAWASGPVRIFSCGRLNVAKGHDNLIRAVSSLAASGVDVRLAIAGEDEEGGFGYRRHLEKMITDLDVSDRVELLGAVGQSVVRDHLDSSHIFVLASHAEPLGVAIMEAMAMGVPVVVGDGGGVRELVDDECGILVDPEHPESIERAIRTLLDDPSGAAAMGQAGQQIVRRSFTTAAGAANLLKHVLAVRPG